MNKQQVALLQRGVDVWNNWRAANPDAKIDLAGADLTGAILIGANLTGANLSKATLYHANLSGANLRSATMTEETRHLAKLGGALGLDRISDTEEVNNHE